MRKKLLMLSFLLLTLVGMLAVTAPVSAQSGCPPSCPLPPPNAASYCAAECRNYNPYYACYDTCYSGLENAAAMECSRCHLCCGY